jgi:hypothetical protein
MATIAKAVEIPISELGKEAFVQELLANDPSLLGLGDLILRGKERIQHSSGRLDLLLESADGSTWYEVEVQLRATDESHIIRTVEYWDNERRHKPNKKHVAVIVAEKITSRFFNVIALFNQHIPIVAIQMQALDVGGQKTIIFTTILNHSDQTEEADEEAYQPTDQFYWRARTSEAIMNIANEILSFAREKNSSIDFKYNKGYIKTTVGGVLSNFITLRPQKKRIRLSVSNPRSAEIDKLIEDAGFEIEYEEEWQKYILWITQEGFSASKTFVRDMIHKAYDAVEAEPSTLNS